MASNFPMKKNTACTVVFPILDADGDLVGGGFGIKLKNVRDIGGGAILAKGVDADGQEYVVFMAPKGK